jgi:hypothetical protein
MPVSWQRIFYLVALCWFFGWGFFLLRFPGATFRFLSMGTRVAEPRNPRATRIVGYMGLFFGVLLLLQKILRWPH